MRAVTFACPGSLADAAARLEAAIDARPWNAAGMDGWIRGGGAVLYYRDAARYRALFRRTFVGQFRQRGDATGLLLPVWLAPAAVCFVLALVPTRLEPQTTGPRIVLLLLGSLLGVLAFGRFALEWWGRPGDREAITQAIRAALHAGDRV